MNQIFNKDREIRSKVFVTLQKFLKQRNIIINTIDVTIPESPSRVIYFDVPYPWEIKLWMNICNNYEKSILFMFEPPIINPFNYMKIFQGFFKKIYTWNDELVDNKRFLKFFLPKTTPETFTKQIDFDKKLFLVFANKNQLAFKPFELMIKTKELYSERIRAVNFFENYARDFSLYGRGWNKPRKSDITQMFFGFRTYKTYKGEFTDKFKILSKFKFCLCFENSEVSGYISEKIFDCFKSGCVPVYLGAPNVIKYIPKNCFIDFRDFSDYDQLLSFLRSMKRQVYESYLRSIREFLRSEDIKRIWFEDGFARAFFSSL